MATEDDDEDDARYEPTILRAVKELDALGADATTIPHVLISAGLAMIESGACDACMVEQLEFVRDEIEERLQALSADTTCCH